MRIKGVTLDTRKLAKMQKADQELKDAIARAGGYINHEDALASRDAEGKVPDILGCHNPNVCPVKTMAGRCTAEHVRDERLGANYTVRLALLGANDDSKIC